MQNSLLKAITITALSTTMFLSGCGGSNNATDNTSTNALAQELNTSANVSPTAALSQELKNTLSYMGNEERLAYDVYNKLYTTTGIMQFDKIATNGESQHIQAVQVLVKKYITDPSEFSNVDLTELDYADAQLSAMQAGTYDVKAIQELYDALILKGEQTNQDALEVGCMIEVTDINDLDRDIALAQASDATDIVSTFELLRNGSYAHYWAFDSAMKNMGITDGCCSLGVVNGVDYCHTEYPQSSQGNGKH